MRLKICHFHKNDQNTGMESFQFQDPLAKIILTINHEPQQKILVIWPKCGSRKFISRNEP